MKRKRSPRRATGFTLIEIAMVVALVAAAGAAAYIAYTRMQDHAEVVPTPTPKPAERSYSLKYEQLKLTYPTVFALADDSKAASVEDGFSPGRDRVLLTKPNGFRLTLQTGATVRSGVCEGCRIQTSETVSVLGKIYSLNYLTIEGRSVTNSAFVATGSTEFYPAGIPGRSITETLDNTKLPFVISMGYYKNGQVAEKSLTEFQTDMADAKKVIESLKYD